MREVKPGEIDELAKTLFGGRRVVGAFPQTQDEAVEKAFDPDEPRDPSGKWTAGGGGGKPAESKFDEKKEVDGIKKLGVRLMATDHPGSYKMAKGTSGSDVVRKLERGGFKQTESNVAYGGMSSTHVLERKGTQVVVYSSSTYGEKTSVSVRKAPPPIDPETAVHQITIHSEGDPAVRAKYGYSVGHGGTDQGKSTGRDDSHRDFGGSVRHATREEALQAAVAEAKKRGFKNFDVHHRE